MADVEGRLQPVAKAVLAGVLVLGEKMVQAGSVLCYNLSWFRRGPARVRAEAPARSLQECEALSAVMNDKVPGREFTWAYLFETGSPGHHELLSIPDANLALRDTKVLSQPLK
jgi:hypothetical protein